MLKKKGIKDSVVTATDTLTYQCLIEGYGYENDSMPRMTDFKAHYRTKYTQTNTTITQPIIKQEKRKIIHIQPQAGFGYGVFNKQPDLYIGLGIGIDI